MTAGETHRAIEATFRIERARLIAGLARLVRNIDIAEELAQDALVTALAEWPRAGIPANPGAWLMAAAKRRAIDSLRRDAMRTRKHEEIARTLDEADDPAETIAAALDDDLGDELLGLIFAALATAIQKATPFALLGFTVITLAFGIKARREERFLRSEIGNNAYDAYARKTAMLVPFMRIGR